MLPLALAGLLSAPLGAAPPAPLVEVLFEPGEAFARPADSPLRRAVVISWVEREDEATGQLAVYARSVRVLLGPDHRLGESEREALERRLERRLEGKLPTVGRPARVKNQPNKVAALQEVAANGVLRAVDEAAGELLELARGRPAPPNYGANASR